MVTKEDVCKAYFDVDFTDTKGNSIRAVKFGKEIGTSGIFLPSYFDHINVSANPESARTIIKYMTKMVRNSGGDFVISSADAGIYWGANVALPLGRGFALVRKNDKLCGAIPKGSVPDIVDDLNTSLKTIMTSFGCITDSEAELNRIFVGIDRQKYKESFLDYLEERGKEIESAVTEQDLIRYGRRVGKVTADDLELMALAEEDYEEFAVQIIEEDPAWVGNHRHYLDMLNRDQHRNSEKIWSAIKRNNLLNFSG